jgi:penicillin-binding protein 1A
VFHQLELRVCLLTASLENTRDRALGLLRDFREWLPRQVPAARRIAGRVLIGVVALPLLGATLVWQHVHHDRSGVPDIEPLVRFEPPTTGQVYDARGEVLLELAREYRWVVRYDEIPIVMREAVLAAEDRNFFSHAGVDYWAWPRVMSRMLTESLSASRRASRQEGHWKLVLRFPQGGSTVTQQLVRGYFLSDYTRHEDSDVLLRPTFVSRTMARFLGASSTNKIRRKLEEMRLSFWLEDQFRRRYGTKEKAKQQILARYASFIYLGNGRYGFSAASEYYFGKPLDSYQPWDADKAALLASIPKSPRDYAPAPGNLERARRRRDTVLALMVKRGSISPELGAHCAREPISLAKPVKARAEAPAVVAHAMRELGEASKDAFTLGQLSEGRIRIRTTVDNRIQDIVNDALENGLAMYEKRHPKALGQIQGSVVVLHNQDGRVLAEAGGRRHYRNRTATYTDFNRAVESFRQPGSALKPVVYLAAFAHGADLDTEVADAPVVVPMGNGRGGKWIGNYDGKFKGPIPLRLALAESRNCATMWIVQKVGLPEVLRQARTLGIRSPLQPYPTTALGASEVNLLELASLYRSLASGVLAQPHIVERVTDASGQQALYEHRPDIHPVPLSAATLESIQEGLRSVVRLPSGTAHALDATAVPIPVMGKTGTTSDFRDALFVGSTYGPRGITVAVRVGFDDNRELGEKETGGRAALPIFREIMLGVYRGQLAGSLPQFPRNIEAGIDRYLERMAAPPPPDPFVVDIQGAPAPTAAAAELVNTQRVVVAPAALAPRTLTITPLKTPHVESSPAPAAPAAPAAPPSTPEKH